MARITMLKMQNFKASGPDLKIELSGRDMLIGPNGSGKTATVQAIKVAVGGKLPEANIGSTSEMFKLASNGPGVDNMEVGIRLDNGFSFSREYERNIKTSPESGDDKEVISQNIIVSPPGPDERTNTQRVARIAAECGVSAVMVDVSAFLDMSDLARRDFFYTLGSPEAVERYEITGSLVGGQEEMNAHSEGAFQKLSVECLDAFDTRGGLDGLLLWLADEKKAAAANALRSKSTTQHMAKVKAQRETVAGDLTTLKGDITATREEREKLSIEVGNHAAQVRSIKEREARIESLMQLITKLKAAKPEKSAVVLSKELKAAEKELKAHRTETEKETSILVAACSNAHDKVSGLDDEWHKVDKEHNTLRGRRDTADSLAELRKKLCAKCKALIDTPLDLSKKIGKVDAKYEKLTDELKEARESVMSCSNAKAEYLQGRSKRDVELECLVDGLPKRIERVKTEKIKVAADLKAADKELKAMQADKLPEPMPIEQTEQRVAGLSARLSDLESKLVDKQEEETQIQIQMQAIAAAQVHATRLFCVKKVIDLFGPKGLKGDIVKQTLAPTRLEVNDCLRLFGIIDREFAFRTVDGRGNEVFDFGWKDQRGRYITFDSLSTGQQTMLLASLVAVICKHSSSPLKFLALDNLETVDSQNSPALFNGLPKVADLCGIDNLIAVSSKIEDFMKPETGAEGKETIQRYVPEGFKMISFGME